jgi:tripartite-type tricarboxylate transporter receptor subunit TctC
VSEIVLSRRGLIGITATSLLAPALPGAAVAQAWPAHFVRLVVPFAAGGPTDVVSRLVGDRLSAMWGKQLVVENRGGAGTNIGAELVARAAADGYTLLLGTSTQAINRHLYKTPGYDAMTDFAPIVLLCLASYIMVVPNTSPVMSVADFIAYAKERKGRISYATPGPGTTPHLCAELFKRLTGIEMTHVPYRGAALGLTDLIAGRVDVTFMSGIVLENVRAGQVRALAVSSVRRLPAAPDLLPVAEAGVPGFDVLGWFALLAPAGTPEPIVSKINADTNAVLADPAVRTQLEKIGYIVGGSTPEELGTLLKTDSDRWGGLIKELGITVGD